MSILIYGSPARTLAEKRYLSFPGSLHNPKTEIEEYIHRNNTVSESKLVQSQLGIFFVAGQLFLIFFRWA